MKEGIDRIKELDNDIELLKSLRDDLTDLEEITEYDEKINLLKREADKLKDERRIEVLTRKKTIFKNRKVRRRKWNNQWMRF